MSTRLRLRRANQLFEREVWLALDVVPMVWLSAVGVIHRLHRRTASRSCPLRGALSSRTRPRRSSQDVTFTIRAMVVGSALGR